MEAIVWALGSSVVAGAVLYLVCTLKFMLECKRRVGWMALAGWIPPAAWFLAMGDDAGQLGKLAAGQMIGVVLIAVPLGIVGYFLTHLKIGGM